MTQISIDVPISTIDISDLEFNLPSELDNLRSLETFEEQVVIAFGDIDEAYTAVSDAYTRAAYHIHMIMEYDLWRHRLTPEGQPLHDTQEEYLADLADRTMRGFAVSTAKGFNTAFLLARDLGYSRQEIEKRGVYIFREMSKYVDKEYGTGKPLRLKDGSTPPDGKTVEEHLKSTVEQITSDSEKPADVVLRPRQFKLELDRALAPHKPEIWFQRFSDNGKDTYHWFYQRVLDDGTLYHRDGKAKLELEGDPPQEVTDKLLTALKLNDN